MSNGLLTGLTEAWMPDATKAMIGQKTGLNTNTAAGLTYVVNAGMPGGHALLGTDSPDVLATAASPLVAEISQTDFLMISWGMSDGGADCPVVLVGQEITSGFDFSQYDGADNGQLQGELTDGGGVTRQIVTDPTTFDSGAAHMLALGWTNSDKTLRIYLDGVQTGSLFIAAGAGTTDASNAVSFQVWFQCGFASLWQGTVGAANAVSQLATLYGSKLQYSDFDAGGGGTLAAQPYYRILAQGG